MPTRTDVASPDLSEPVVFSIGANGAGMYTALVPEDGNHQQRIYMCPRRLDIDGVREVVLGWLC
jgi:hypothetical protein